jgi:predicted transcriptional regulator
MATVTPQIERHYRIGEVAKLLGLSRAGVYNILRGEVLVDFSRPGKKGIKLVPESTLKRLLDQHTKTFR